MSRFDRFVAIDWTGARGTRHRAIEVAVCEAGDEPPVLLRPARPWSRTEVADWLAAHAREGLPTLLGLDASFGLPHADRCAFFPGARDEPADARSLWAEVEAVAADDPDLAAHSFVAYRRAWFWTGAADGPQRDFARLRVSEAVHAAAGLGNPASPYVLLGASQVGKATLSAMRLLARLDGALPVWPFDPLPATGPVLVEIYCQAFAKMGGFRGKLRDRASLNRALAALGSRPVGNELPDRFDDHVGDAMVSAAGMRAIADDPRRWAPEGLTDAVRRTEGWTWGVA